MNRKDGKNYFTMERNVEALVVGGIGQHAFEVARRNMKIFDGKEIFQNLSGK